MAAPLTQIRSMAETIISQLRLVFRDGTSIDHLAGIANARDLDQLIARGAQSFGIGLVNIVPSSTHLGMFTAHWQILAACSASGEFQRRFLGDDQSIGLYAMLIYAAAVLNRVPVPEIGVLEITKIEQVVVDGWSKDGTALATIDLACTFILPSPPGFGVADLPDFISSAPSVTQDGAKVPTS